jgi:hypothetical protein
MRILSFSATIALAFGLFLMAQQTSAQETPPSQFEHIQGLEPLVGFWRAEAPAEDGGGPISLSCRLTGNRSYLQLQVSAQVEGQRESMGTMLIGQDHAKNQVSLWGFWPNRQGFAKVEVGEGSASWSESSVMAEGGKETANVSMKVDGDKLTVDITDVKHGDEAQPDMHFTFTRSERRGRRGGGQ